MTTTTDRWALTEGSEIAPGRHAVKLLGRGERYETYVARDDRLGCHVVAKVLRPDRLDDRSAHEGLAAEAEMLIRLRHPVIVRSLDEALDAPLPHVALEHLDGPALSTLVRMYGPLPLEQLVPLATQICAALHYMTAEGVVHLDIKPRNIIMGGPPRLIDLSIARTLEETARLRYRVGTDAYMAPEQWAPRDLGPVGPPADVWGLGATLYNALTGIKPFPSGDKDEDAGVERYEHRLAELPTMGRRVPAALEDLVWSCLRIDPELRPTASELSAGLEPFVAAIPKRPVLSRLRPRI